MRHGHGRPAGRWSWWTRRLVRRLRTNTFSGASHLETIGDVDLQRDTLEYLCLLEDALRQRIITPVEFEDGWSTAWSAIAGR